MEHEIRIAQLERILRANRASRFIDAVASEPKPTYILMTLDAFYGEPDLLHAALEYASLRDRDVLLVAGGGKSPVPVNLDNAA